MLFKDSPCKAHYNSPNGTRVWVIVIRACWSSNGCNSCTKHSCVKALLPLTAAWSSIWSHKSREPPDYALGLSGAVQFLENSLTTSTTILQNQGFPDLKPLCLPGFSFNLLLPIRQQVHKLLISSHQQPPGTMKGWPWHHLIHHRQKCTAD